ncbi:MAG TPA: amidohydrolase family protein [Bacteroidales bacterium]|nr:amidohydrolase family protein [Bacteroidales bacterium]
MKKQLIFLSALILSSCQESSYNRIRNYLETIDIVDTHEHLQVPADSNNFFLFNTVSYFASDITSAGAPSYSGLQKYKFNADSLWNKFGKFYNYSRSTSYHEQFMNSLRILYDYQKPYVVKEDIPDLYNRMLINHYRNYGEWFDKVYRDTRFKTMLLDQYWNHFNTDIDTRYFKLVCNISNCVLLVNEAAGNKKITSEKNLLKFMDQQEISTGSLDDYLKLVDSVIEKFKNKGAVCLKNVLAYSRSVYFEDVDYVTATKIYNKKEPLNREEQKKLQDFVFHHIIGQAIKLDLPIQIHTGYLAGNRSWLDNGQPMKLLNLFMKYPEARFILFHGGYPWTGDYVALGKQFSNVYLDLVWLPQISKTSAINTLHEMLDAMPYNKIMWGGDVLIIDDAVGSLELGKEVVATVLSERVERGWMTEEIAIEIAGRIFRDNAMEIFKLN